MILIASYTLLFHICQILVIHSLVSHYETYSNASQYPDLENLIGSLHAYSHNHSRLVVHNTGLTEGQENLLKRYANVQVVPASHDQPTTKYPTVNVDDQFILVNDTLIAENNRGQRLFIDSIRKQLSLVVVMPFVSSHVDQLLHQLNLTHFYRPCRKPTYDVDLIFYHNENSSSALHTSISQLNYEHECFRQVHRFAAGLSADEDPYPSGSGYMWKKLFVDGQTGSVSLRDRGYTHFFLMEPDTRPIRAYWLDALVARITCGHDPNLHIASNWWMVGSLYRGSIELGRNYIHINGNALYHLSLDFFLFIQKVSKEIPYVLGKSNGYDLDLFVYLNKHADVAKVVWHKFQFTDFIQNCWHTGCNDTDPDFIHKNPNTYFVHGQLVPPKSNSWRRTFFYLALTGLMLASYKRLRRWCSRIRWRRHDLFSRS